MKVVFVELDRCLACRNCERVCSFQEAGGFRRDQANIWVYIDPDRRSIFTMTCLQCENAPCMEICPAGAMTRDPQTGAVVVDEHLCVGCKMCVSACPFGCVHFEPQRRVAVKCNLCNGHPRCVENCMAGALHYADINELARIKRRKMDRNMAQMAKFHPGEHC